MSQQIIATTDLDQEFIVREAGENIVEGAVVVYEPEFADDADALVLTVEPIPVGSSLKLAVGVAMETVSDGDQVRICTSGTAKVLVDGTTDVAINGSLIASAGTAGEVILYAAAIAAEPTFAEAADISNKIVPLDAQSANDGTLTWCLVSCR